MIKLPAVWLSLSVTGWAAVQLPAAFEPNRGQTPFPADFVARGRGYSLAVRSNGADIVTRDARIGAILDGARAVSPQPEDRLPGVVNYIHGNDPSRWLTHIPTWSRVRYRGVWPSIDVVYYGAEGRLEYDFVVAPGADPRRIRLRFEGGRGLRLDEAGDLLIETGAGALRQHRPMAYQEIAGSRHEIAVRYMLHGGSVGIEVGRYDRKRPLIVDPVLTWSTYFGSSGGDTGEGLAADSSGNVYLAGGTVQGNTGYDIFISKLKSDGTATLLTIPPFGSNYDDIAHALAIDSAGNSYLTGQTATATFFGTLDIDLFIAKVDPTGKILYATSFGGSGGDIGYGIAVDASGNSYIVGATNSPDFPTHSGAPQRALAGGIDAFVIKFDSTGNGLAATYFGGSSDEYGNAITLDSSGNVWITGYTSSPNFPVSNAAYQARTAGGVDAFITRFGADLSLQYSTYLGGSGNDSAYGIAVDSSGAVYVAGQTASSDFPLVNPAQKTFGGSSDVFIAKLNAGGASLGYSTYLGGSGDDGAYGLAIDPGGNAYVTGATNSKDFPVVDAFQSTNQGTFNALVAGLDASGALLFSSYLGGNGSAGQDGDNGNAIVASCSAGLLVAGTTESSNFPTTAGVVQSTYRGGASDAFLARIGILGTPVIASGGVVNAATSTAGRVAPGSLVSIYGSALTIGTQQAAALPLPTTFGGGASVTMNGTPAPIVYASPGQINVQVPYEVGPGSATISVTTPCGASAPTTFDLNDAAPYIFSIGNNVAAVRNQDNSINGPDNPAASGSVITVYLTGIGPTDNQPATGAPDTLLAHAKLSNSATIDGVNAPVGFLGLSPGFVGLAQANLTVPAGLNAGSHPVVINVNGVNSNNPVVYTK